MLVTPYGFRRFFLNKFFIRPLLWWTSLFWTKTAKGANSLQSDLDECVQSLLVSVCESFCVHTHMCVFTRQKRPCRNNMEKPGGRPKKCPQTSWHFFIRKCAILSSPEMERARGAWEAREKITWRYDCIYMKHPKARMGSWECPQQGFSFTSLYSVNIYIQLH